MASAPSSHPITSSYMATASTGASRFFSSAIIFAKHSLARTSGRARNSSEHMLRACSAAAKLPSVSSHSYIASCICGWAMAGGMARGGWAAADDRDEREWSGGSTPTAPWRDLFASMSSQNLLRAQRRRAELEEQRRQQEHLEREEQRLLLEQQELQQELQQRQQHRQQQQHPAQPAPTHIISSSPKRRHPLASGETDRGTNDNPMVLEAQPMPRSPTKSTSAAIMMQELRIAHEAQLAELHHAHAHALEKAMAAASREAEARAAAEAAASDAQRRAEAADDLCQRAAAEARSAATHFAEHADERERAFASERDEHARQVAALRDALEAAHAAVDGATHRAAEAEAAAESASVAAMEARELARREAGSVVASRLGTLEERARRAEAQLVEEHRAQADRRAAMRDVAVSPIAALVLAEQAEASRHQVALHELRQQQRQHEVAKRQYAELARRAAALRQRVTNLDSDDESDPGPDGWAADDADDEHQLGRAHEAPSSSGMPERERRRRLAQTMLAWFIATQRR